MAGCFSISNVNAPNGHRHVHTSNYGWYLFNFIPIACGNAAKDAIIPFVLFRNDVTMDKIQRRLFDSAGEENRKPSNISYVCHNEIFFEIPGTNIPVPVPYVLCYKEIQLSGELE